MVFPIKYNIEFEQGYDDENALALSPATKGMKKGLNFSEFGISYNQKNQIIIMGFSYYASSLNKSVIDDIIDEFKRYDDAYDNAFVKDNNNDAILFDREAYTDIDDKTIAKMLEDLVEVMTNYLAFDKATLEQFKQHLKTLFGCYKSSPALSVQETSASSSQYTLFQPSQQQSEEAQAKQPQPAT